MKKTGKTTRNSKVILTEQNSIVITFLIHPLHNWVKCVKRPRWWLLFSVTTYRYICVVEARRQYFFFILYAEISKSQGNRTLHNTYLSYLFDNYWLVNLIYNKPRLPPSGLTWHESLLGHSLWRRCVEIQFGAAREIKAMHFLFELEW